MKLLPRINLRTVKNTVLLHYMKMKQRRIDIDLMSMSIFERMHISYQEDYEISGKVCIFAAYQINNISEHVWRSLKHLYKSGYFIVFINNSPLTFADKDLLKGWCHIVAERENLGRDFGAYKDGVALLNEVAPFDKITHLILMNDTIFFPLFDDTDLLHRLETGEADVSGPYENQECSYHIGSYFLYFRDTSFRREWFANFWDFYKPWSDRVHAINNGELALSRAAIVNGHKPMAIYTTTRLRHTLQDMTIEQIRDIGANLMGGFPWSVEDKGSLINFIVTQIDRGNPSHMGAIVLNKALKSPIIKHDLAFRGLFTPGNVCGAIDTDDESWRDIIHREYRAKGTPQSFTPWQKFLYKMSVI